MNTSRAETMSILIPYIGEFSFYEQILFWKGLYISTVET